MLTAGVLLGRLHGRSLAVKLQLTQASPRSASASILTMLAFLRPPYIYPGMTRRDPRPSQKTSSLHSLSDSGLLGSSDSEYSVQVLEQRVAISLGGFARSS